MKIDLSELTRLKTRLNDVSSSLNSTLYKANRELDSISNLVNSRSLGSAINSVRNKIFELTNVLNTNLPKIEEFMGEQISSYTTSNEEAKGSLNNLVSLIDNVFDSKGNIKQIASQYLKTTAASNALLAKGVDASVYNSKPSKGFNVTTDNKTYELSDSDFDLICSIVAAESDKTPDDALAVASTILNRCEASNWVASHGTNPVKQATAYNQFVVYQEGLYKQYTNGRYPDSVKNAVISALNGVRNHDYLSFRSNGTTSYSSNMITATGNRYK